MVELNVAEKLVLCILNKESSLIMETKNNVIYGEFNF